MTDKTKIILGSGLIVTGVLPTPDDVTVISPLIQIVAGGILVIAGLMTDEK